MVEDEYRKRWASSIPAEFSATRRAPAPNKSGKVSVATLLPTADFHRLKTLAASQGETVSSLLLVLIREFLDGTSSTRKISPPHPITGPRGSVSTPLASEDHAALVAVAATEWLSISDLLRRIIHQALEAEQDRGSG